MDDFAAFLPREAIVADLVVANKKTLFQSLAALSERVLGVESRVVLEKLNERERLGTTGFGGGVAIPHGRIDGLDHIRAAFIRLNPDARIVRRRLASETSSRSFQSRKRCLRRV